MTVDWPMIAIAVAIIGHALAYYFRTPKEENSQNAIKIASLDSRLTTLEIAHAGSTAGLNATICGLEKSVEELKESIDKLRDAVIGQKSNRRAPRT